MLENGWELLHSELINLEVLRKVRFHLPAIIFSKKYTAAAAARNDSVW